MQDFINELHKRNAPTTVIVGYEFENELVFHTDKKPLSLSSGTVQTASGVYDMTSQKELATINQSLSENSEQTKPHILIS